MPNLVSSTMFKFDRLLSGIFSVYYSMSKFFKSSGYSIADSSESKPTLFGVNTIADKFWKVTSSFPLFTLLICVYSRLPENLLSRFSFASLLESFTRLTISISLLCDIKGLASLKYTVIVYLTLKESPVALMYWKEEGVRVSGI